MSETNNKQKQKICILGGGMSGLAAAHELTDYEGWNDHYDVTLYQMGWRLGGKCGTGRGINDRIEEHGIHVFLGFYNNAIRLVRRSFDEWKEKAEKKDYHYIGKEWTDLFHRQDSILLPQYSTREGRWLNWPLEFPPNKELPGVNEEPVSRHTNVKKMFLLSLEMLLGSPYLEKNRGCIGGVIHNIWKKAFPQEQQNEPVIPPANLHYNETHTEAHPSWWGKMRDEVMEKYKHVEGPPEIRYLHHARTLVQQLPDNPEEAAAMKEAFTNGEHHHHKVGKLVHEFTKGIEKRIAHRVHSSTQLSRWWLMAQMAWAMFKGAIEIYDPETGELDFDSINHLDLRDWLRNLGASEEVIWSAPIKDLYALVFAYPNGDSTKPGQIAAGTALQGGMLIILGYKGSVMWKFHGGTADIIVSPMYEVLLQRGVKVKFFHEVEEIFHSETGEIEKIQMGQQIRLKDEEKGFQPTRYFKGLDIWAEHPFWRWPELKEQVDPEDMERLEAGNINLMSSWSGWENVNSFEMQKGRDFDQVVLAIPVAALKDICPTIIDKEEKWSSMVREVATVQTQAVQIWLKPTLEQMGMKLPEWGLRPTDQPILDTYANPINSWSDMTELINWENWREGNTPGNLSYYCGPMLETGPLPPYSDTSVPAAQEERVREMASQWFADNSAFLWPDAANPENPTGLDLDLLVDPEYDPRDPESKEAGGQEKFRRQFFRANIDPTERYTLSLPGSAKFRMKTDASGFHNLFLAGDWIDTGYNMGCVEVTVMSGLMAAQALRKNCYGMDKHKVIIRDL